MKNESKHMYNTHRVLNIDDVSPTYIPFLISAGTLVRKSPRGRVPGGSVSFIFCLHDADIL